MLMLSIACWFTFLFGPALVIVNLALLTGLPSHPFFWYMFAFECGSKWAPVTTRRKISRNRAHTAFFFKVPDGILGTT